MSPLAAWREGVHAVALNLQTNDLPSQLHHALFKLGSGSGFVLKPLAMRQSDAVQLPTVRTSP